MMLGTLSATTPTLQTSVPASQQAQAANEAIGFSNFATQYGYHIVYTPPTSTCNGSGAVGSTSNCPPPTSNAQFQGPYGPNGAAIWLVPNDPNQTNIFAINYLGETVLPAWDATSQSQAGQQRAQCPGLLACFLPNCLAGAELGALGCIPVWAGTGILLLLLLVNQ